MKRIFVILFVVATLSVLAGLAYAWRLDCNSSDTICEVICKNGDKAGKMYWNGTNWSDGLRSNIDKDKLAAEIVKAWGTSCR